MIIWTATKIDDATFCIKNFDYKYIKKVKLQATGPQARGIFLHRQTIDLYRPDRTMKYKSAESFANQASARFTFIIKRGSIQGRKIEWKDKSEPWQIREDTKKLCKIVYERYSQEEPPLFREVPFNFVFDGRHYKGRIDEIRKKRVIRDLKSGRRAPEKMKLAYDPQFTLYALAFMNMCYADREFAEACGVSEEEVERWAGNPDFLSEKVMLEYYFIRENKIFPAIRTNSHYHDFCEMLDGIEEQIQEGRFYPKRGRNCDYCDCKKICDAETVAAITPPTREKQLWLFQAPPRKSEIIQPTQLKMKFPRKR